MRSWSPLLLVALAACFAHAERPREAVTITPRVERVARERASADVQRATKHEREAPPEPRFTREPLWHPAPHEVGPLPRWIEHDSIPHDSIDSLAIRYGVPPRKLRRWNRMSPRGQLHPRTPKDLKVRAKRFPPPRERLVHEVVEGDSYDSIARRYAVIDSRLRAWNVREIGRTLEPGEQVSVWIEPLVYQAMLEDGPAPGRAASIPPGGTSVGTPQRGRLAAGVQVPPGEGYERLYPNSTWGTTYAVRNLVETLDEFHATGGYEGTLILGSMSFRRGGKIGGHVSHQSGRDIDIRLPQRPGVPRSEPATGRNVDWDAAWALLLEFAYSGAVQRIFLDYGVQRRLYRRARAAGVDELLLAELLQYPRGRRSSGGIVHHSPGHEGHMHVRYACGPYEPECGN